MQIKFKQILINNINLMNNQQLREQEPITEPRDKKFEQISALPVKTHHRTDNFCTIVNTTFVVLLFVIFLFTFNGDNLRKITYPNDAEGTLCGYDAPDYPYLYYASLTDPSKRLCVSQCPTATDTALVCKPTAGLSCMQNSNPKYEVTIYDSYLDNSRVGLFCFPTDSNLKQQVISNSRIHEKYDFLGFYDSVFRSIWIAVIFAISSFLFAHFLPYQSVVWTILVGSICSILFGLLILILANGYFLVKLLLFIFFVTLGVFSGISLFNSTRKESIFICSRLIHAATITHERKDHTKLVPFSLEGLQKLIKPFLLILCFMVLFGAFLVLILFQVLSAWSCGKLVYRADYPFYEVVGFGSNFLQILIFFEFIWGMTFLKEAFNYIVSGHAARWYFAKQTDNIDNPENPENQSYLPLVEQILLYHWGSIAGGSLLLSYFYFVDLVLDFFWPEDSQKVSLKKEKNPIDWERSYDEQNKGFKSFFNLVRSQAFAYTSLTSLPYCVSARYCEFLSSESGFYNLSQTTNRIFRINQHIIPIFFTVLIAIITMKAAGQASPYGILFVCFVTFFTVTYFLAYHGDKAEGILISAYVDEVLNDGDLQCAPAVIAKAYKDDDGNEYKQIPLWDMLFSKNLNPE